MGGGTRRAPSHTLPIRGPRVHPRFGGAATGLPIPSPFAGRACTRASAARRQGYRRAFDALGAGERGFFVGGDGRGDARTGQPDGDGAGEEAEVAGEAEAVEKDARGAAAVAGVGVVPGEVL